MADLLMKHFCQTVSPGSISGRMGSGSDFSQTSVISVREVSICPGIHSALSQTVPMQYTRMYISIFESGDRVPVTFLIQAVTSVQWISGIFRMNES